MSDGWEEVAQDWLVGPGHSCGALLCYVNGEVYSCAHDTSDDSLGTLRKETIEYTYENDDGTQSTVTINEFETQKIAIEEGKPPPYGVFIGGKKYTFIKQEKDFGFGDNSYTYVQLGIEKGGAFIIRTSNTPAASYLVVLYDEDKEQKSQLTLTAAFKLADVILENE